MKKIFSMLVIAYLSLVSTAAFAVDSVCEVALILGKYTPHHTVSWTTADASFGGWIRIISEVTAPSWLGVWDDYPATSPWEHRDFVPNPVNAIYAWDGESYAGFPDAEGEGFWFIPYDFCSNSAPIYNELCSDSLITNTAINRALNWPSAEPWERGSILYCSSSTGTFSFWNCDSFGQYNADCVPTNDPCVLTMAGAPSSNIVGAIHSHPYFTTASQMTAGVGCLGDTTSPTAFEIAATNNANNNFSDNDDAWVTQTSTPFFLKTPQGDHVKRMSTSYGVTTVY